MDAKARLAKMDADAKQLDLGQRVISRYGCYSCHQIKGFETTQPIGTELSEEGSKLVTRLDFAFVPIPHSKLAWFHQKLHDPRSFDAGRVLEPLEKLRMPDFHLSEAENERLQTAIMSFQREIQPASALPPRTAKRDYIIAGRALVRRQNCVGCHEIEGDGGDFKKLVADPTLAPPLLTPEGAKVQPDWLYAFLQAPITIRPWLAVRMPTFGLDDGRWNEIIRYFEATGDSIGPFRTYNHAELTSMAGPGQADVRAVEVPAVPRAGNDSGRPAEVEPRARFTDGARAAAAGMDSAMAAESVQNSARHAHAPVLAELSEVRFPADG